MCVLAEHSLIYEVGELSRSQGAPLFQGWSLPCNHLRCYNMLLLSDDVQCLVYRDTGEEVCDIIGHEFSFRWYFLFFQCVYHFLWVLLLL